jgi:hypothetical protein
MNSLILFLSVCAHFLLKLILLLPEQLAESAVGGGSLQPTFTAKPAFLVAAKRTGRVEFVAVARPDDAGAQFVDRSENLAAFVRPDARAQAT